MMETPFSKTISFARKYSRLLETVNATDTLGILINADPDSMASAMVLKRIFWNKVRRILIYRINSIKRADFLEIRDDYGANASIMTAYLKAGKIKPSPKLATGLFYGIKTDTHTFAGSAKPNDINAFKS